MRRLALTAAEVAEVVSHLERQRMRAVGGATWLVGAWIATGACAVPTAPSPSSVDVLDYVIGDSGLWPRHGAPNHHQHQNLEPDRVCWTKYTLGWSFECWRWTDAYVYHEVDHGIDGKRWEHYVLSDGRWMPRRIAPGAVWTLDLPENRLTWYDADCTPQPERAAPYRVRVWLAGPLDAGGDLGVRDVLILEYHSNLADADPNTTERFYFAHGAGWYRWTRGAADVTFNIVGGVARAPTPWCRRDFEG